MEITCLPIDVMTSKLKEELIDFKTNRFIIISSFGLEDDLVKMEDCRVNRKDILTFRFIDEVVGDHCITVNEARAIIDFASKCIEDDVDLIVCCDGGVSRSAAVVAFLQTVVLGLSLEQSVFTECSKCPNERVLSVMLTAFTLMVDISDEEINQMTDKLFNGFEINRRMFNEQFS